MFTAIFEVKLASAAVNLSSLPIQAFAWVIYELSFIDPCQGLLRTSDIPIMLLPVVTTLLGVAFVVASPVVIHESPVTLAQVRRLNLTGTQKLVEADQIRARYLRNHARSAQGQRLDGRAVFPVPLTNVGTGYTIQVRMLVAFWRPS